MPATPTNENFETRNPSVSSVPTLAYRGLNGHFDGMVDSKGEPWQSCKALHTYLTEIGIAGLQSIQRDADLSLLNQGMRDQLSELFCRRRTNIRR